jgi:hypothetical protein
MSKGVKASPKRRRRKLPPLTPAEHQEIAERMRVFEEDTVWVEEHYDELLAKYPEEWIAVDHKQVIAHDPDFFALIARVPTPGQTYHTFLTRDKVEVIL